MIVLLRKTTISREDYEFVINTKWIKDLFEQKASNIYEEIFNKVDENQNKLLSLQEFISAIRLTGLCISWRESEKIFNSIIKEDPQYATSLEFSYLFDHLLAFDAYYGKDLVFNLRKALHFYDPYGSGKIKIDRFQ